MTWQPAAVLYPDVEQVVCESLRSLIDAHDSGDTVWVGRTLPKKRPTRAVQVVRDGGNSANLRDTARIRVLVWDREDEDANDLARLIVALTPLLVGGSVLRTEHLSGPYEIPDATPKRYLLFEIHFRGTPL